LGAKSFKRQTFEERKTVQEERIAEASRQVEIAKVEMEKAMRPFKRAYEKAYDRFRDEFKKGKLLEQERAQATLADKWHAILKEPDAFWTRYTSTIPWKDIGPTARVLYACYSRLTRTELLDTIRFCLEHQLHCPDPDDGWYWCFSGPVPQLAMDAFAIHHPTISRRLFRDEHSIDLRRLRHSSIDNADGKELVDEIVQFVQQWKDSKTEAAKKALELSNLPEFPTF